jgi:hypothetical protein
MPNTAEEVIYRCRNATAFTLAGGYAVADDGRRVLFQPCRIKRQEYHERGRCKRLEGEYPDGSQILYTFTYSEGPRLTARASP